MRKSFYRQSFVAALIVCSWAATTIAQDAETAKPSAADAKTELEKVNKRRSDLNRQLNVVWKKFLNGPETAEVRAAQQKAYQTYLDTGKNDPAIVASKAAQVAAKEKLDKLVEEKLAASEETAAAQKSVDTITEKLADVRFRAATAQFKLTHPFSPWQRQLDRDPKIVELKQKASVTAGRQAALRAYNSARQAKLKTLEDVQPLFEEIETANREIKKLDTELRTAQQGIDGIRKSILTGKDPGVAAAQKELTVANAAVTAAWKSQQIVDLYAKYTATFEAYKTKMNDLMKTDPVAGPLTKERDGLNEKVKALEKLAKAK